MALQGLEDILRDFSAQARLVKNKPYRQVWRFEAGGRPYFLKFYPRAGFRDRFRRLFRGSPALIEFKRLQWLARAGVCAPHAVATLLGFAIDGRKGDAVILEGLEPAVQLDRCLNEHEVAGQPLAGRREIVRQILGLLQNLARAGLGHRDLHLGNFVLHQGRVHLLDAYAVHRSGLLLDDILLLALSAAPYVTRAELVRAWNVLGPGGPLPAINRRGPGVWHSLVVRAFRKDRYFGHLVHETDNGVWEGHVFKRAKFPHRWSDASKIQITEAQWQHAWLILHRQMESGELRPLKESPSGAVYEAELDLGDRKLAVVVKQPRAKNLARRISQFFLGRRARRAWIKAWELVVRAIPTAWPLALMCKRDGDAVIVMEKVVGVPLADIKPADDPPCYGQTLRRCGRLLRRLEQSGLYLYDAKAHNWIIRPDELLGATPVLVDMDSIRRLPQGGGLVRLTRSLREIHGAAFSDALALELARGYRPGANSAALAKLAGLRPTSPPRPPSPPATASRPGEV